MEMVIEPGNVKKALARVRRNKGAPGIDGMRVEDLGAHLQGHWPEIRSLLLSGTYTPQAVRQVEIPKASGGVRALGVPTVVDRFIQQAVMQVLQREWDPGFSDSSYGFRPGRSAHQAVKRAQDHIRAGFGIVVDLDLEKFFDQVCHDVVMGLVAKRVSDRRLLRVIRGFLSAGALVGGLVSPRVEGTPQGGPLSPLLSNLMLDVVDKELESRGHRFVRYADDCNIYVRSRRAGERVMASVTGFLARRLRLRVNTAKSAVARPSRRSFLGFSFTVGGRAKLRLAPQALARFKSRVRKLTRGTKRVSLPRLVSELSRYLVGWRGYFGFCETPSVLRSLDQWIRRRLRAAVWRQWKRGRRRFAALRRLGVGKDLAAKTAGSPCGPWRLSNSPALSHWPVQCLFHSARSHPLDRGPPSRLIPSNRRVRTRMHGGVGGEEPRGFPLSRSVGDVGFVLDARLHTIAAGVGGLWVCMRLGMVLNARGAVGRLDAIADVGHRGGGVAA